MKKIAVFTSGGDAPGMNACLRAVVRTAIYSNLEIVGIRHGYQGMIEGDFVPLEMRSVSNIIQRGGTILYTGRSKDFMKKSGRRKAAMVLEREDIDALIAIGGDGTFHGAYELWREWHIPTIGIPATIDNDLYGTDFTIGFDTSTNTALCAVDKIRDTAAAHERVFIVEVMGRSAGFIGLDVGTASGAEEILIPETETNIDRICTRLKKGRAKGKTSSIIIVSEGDECGGAIKIGEEIKKKIKLNYRICILGHIQRGGAPSVKDRILASKLGYTAIKELLKGKKNVMVGEVNNKIRLTPIKDTWTKKKPIDKTLLRMAEILTL